MKHINVVSLARGYVLVYKGLQEEVYKFIFFFNFYFQGHKAAFLKDFVSALRYYESALLAYEAALNSTPNDPSLLRSYAKVMRKDC